jgi:hypothetical protein
MYNEVLKLLEKKKLTYKTLKYGSYVESDLLEYNKQCLPYFAEDYEFNMELLYTFNKSMIINAPIYYY